MWFKNANIPTKRTHESLDTNELIIKTWIPTEKEVVHKGILFSAGYLSYANMNEWSLSKRPLLLFRAVTKKKYCFCPLSVKNGSQGSEIELNPKALKSTPKEQRTWKKMGFSLPVQKRFQNAPTSGRNIDLKAKIYSHSTNASMTEQLFKHLQTTGTFRWHRFQAQVSPAL